MSWRNILLRLFSSGVAVTAASAALRLARRLRGDAFARSVLDRFGAAFVWSGWPYGEPGYINLHSSRFYWRVQRAIWGTPRVAARRPAPPSGEPLRVGMVTSFLGTLATQKPMFDALPSGMELHVFDRQFAGAGAEYLRGLAASYHSFPDEAAAGEVAAAINRAPLDLLLSVQGKAFAYDVIDGADTPCVVNVCVGSDLVHHDKISFHLYCQPQFDYQVAGDRLRSVDLDEPFGARVYDSWVVFDPRDIPLDAGASWAAREPLIVWHGSLYKIASASFLDTIFGLLQEDSTLEFVFFGKESGGALSTIDRAARARRVEARVHYEGSVRVGRDSQGVIRSEGFAGVVSALGRARLWPNSFPIGGASARFEAYATGAPTAHLALRSPTSESGSLLDLPSLAVPGGSAGSIEAYRRLCRRCLSDGAFADTLVREQIVVARRVSDGRAWWRHVLRCYDDWKQAS
jgi:hypothetical protein